MSSSAQLPAGDRRSEVRLNGLTTLGCLAIALGVAGRLTADEGLGVRAPEGFTVSLYADDDLAHDIFSMTIDSLGRVVVSGPGYVRILVDSDNDSRADRFLQFADGPTTGAQGLYFDGRDLLCTGDAGLLRYRDSNADDIADGPPDVLLKMKAGDEHEAHAVRKGPDGFWYLICGNATGIDQSYLTLRNSPVQSPESGTILRLAPAFSGAQVVAHGFRNPYDFDFGPSGDLFTFDSDGEREVSLPWYEPTRVFQVAPGSHAGWCDESWKRPGRFFDMPPIVGAFGRGCPTGVVWYRHTQFPEPYRSALFILDWTYGRALALPLTRKDSTVAAEPLPFMSAVGEHGFAPTDAEVGPDGSLFVSIGGRGTRGGIYRVSWVGGRSGSSNSPATADQQLVGCLDAPQPYSSWSRRAWEPLAGRLGKESFVTAAIDENQPEFRRVRAIEILTERFGGLDDDLARKLAVSPQPKVRARAAWSLGRTRPESTALVTFVSDSDAVVQRHALEALLGAEQRAVDAAAAPIAACLGSRDRFVRAAASRVLSRMGEEKFGAASAAGVAAGGQATIAAAAALCARHPGCQASAALIALDILESKNSRELKRDAVRLLQIALGDLGPTDGRIPPAFRGYTSRVDTDLPPTELETITTRVVRLFPHEDGEVNYELGRVIAMLAPDDVPTLDRVVSQITEGSDPVDDLHRLIVSARIRSPRNRDIRNRIAAAFIGIDAKTTERSLAIDRNWDDSVSQMYRVHVERDHDLPLVLLSQPGFGRAVHVVFAEAVPREALPKAIAAFLRQIDADPNYAWAPELVLLLSQSHDPAVRDLICSKFDDFALRNAVLTALAEEPRAEDRDKFVAGLQSAPLEVLAQCVRALGRIEPASPPWPEEQVGLVRILRRLGNNGLECQVRDRVIELLERNSARRFDDRPAKAGLDQHSAIDQWTAFVREKFPEEFARQSGESAANLDELRERLARVDWASCDTARGRKLFEARACIQCHGNRGALGPDLNGATSRFSRDDLFTAIALPSRDVSPRYQTTMIGTAAGKVFTGLVVYESVDGLVLRNSTNQTFRIESRDIEYRRALSTSLMPEGLLKDLTDRDLADLYAYLKTLTVHTAEREQSFGGNNGS
ncbi:MAG: DUF7133 domain-containing protein [Planctomycetaceae bacterium]